MKETYCSGKCKKKQSLKEDYLYLYSETQLLKSESEMMRDNSKFTLSIALITGEFRNPRQISLSILNKLVAPPGA